MCGSGGGGNQVGGATARNVMLGKFESRAWEGVVRVVLPCAALCCGGGPDKTEGQMKVCACVATDGASLGRFIWLLFYGRLYHCRKLFMSGAGKDVESRQNQGRAVAPRATG